MRILIPLLMLTALPARAQDTLGYAKVHDLASHAVLPRLTDTRDPRTRDVNRQLDSISADLRCMEKVDPFGHATEHWSVTRVAYAADSILSVFIRFGGFCGGAHPINGQNASVTFDLRTGKPVPLEALFADWERDRAAIVRVLFAKQVAGAERLRAEGREVGEDDEDYCLQFYSIRELVDGYFAYTLSDSGLVVERRMPHVNTACTEGAVVPYDRLLPFVAPGGLLAVMASQRSGPEE
jgi:hypothetical protein